MALGSYNGGSLVSVASTNARSDSLWILSGVETHPAFRGYATSTMYALIREAFRHVGRVPLFVDSENEGALKL